MHNPDEVQLEEISLDSISVLTDRSSAYELDNDPKESGAEFPDSSPPAYNEHVDEKEEIHERSQEEKIMHVIDSENDSENEHVAGKHHHHKKHKQKKHKKKNHHHHEHGEKGEDHHHHHEKGEHHHHEQGEHHEHHEHRSIAKVSHKKPREIVEYKPWFLYFILLVDSLFYLWVLYQADFKVEDLKSNMMIAVDPDILVEWGAKVTRKIVDEGQVWRLVTAFFLHNSVLHWFSSMLALSGPFSRSLEKQYGHWRVMTVFMLSGIYGTMVSSIFIPDDIGTGATGPWFGLMGTMVAEFLQAKHKSARYFAYICITSVILLGMGLIPWIDNYAHIGGWLCGVVTGMVLLHAKTGCQYYNDQHEPCTKVATHFCPDCKANFCTKCNDAIHQKGGGRSKHKPKKNKKSGKNFMVLVWSFILFVMFFVTIVVLFTGYDMASCKSCRWFNCVDTPLWDCCVLSYSRNNTVGNCKTSVHMGQG